MTGWNKTAEQGDQDFASGNVQNTGDKVVKSTYWVT